jgi:hypothetical protein
MEIDEVSAERIARNDASFRDASEALKRPPRPARLMTTWGAVRKRAGPAVRLAEATRPPGQGDGHRRVAQVFSASPARLEVSREQLERQEEH